MAETKGGLKVGDLVLAQEESLPWGEWPVGVITAVDTGLDGLVRAATFRTISRENVERAVQKLILLDPSHST